MSDEFFGDRRKALEESFFHQRDRELLEYLKANMAQQEQKAQLKSVSGIRDEALLDKLLELQLTPESLAAMTLVPLILVAWADDKIQDAERAAILSAAHDQGIETDSASYRLLQSWLAEKPSDDFTITWKQYTQEVVSSLDADAQDVLRQNTLGRAERVAAAAGGVMGLNKISAAEQKVLDELAKVFDT